MGVTYIQVDSRHRLNHEQSSKIHVQLSRPIERPKSVSLQSFGTANEYYNVLDGNNQIQIVSQIYDEQLYKLSTYTLLSGFYTVEEIISELNRQVTDNGGKLNNDSSITFTPSFDSVTQKSNFTFVGPSKSRVVVYYPDNDEFDNSVLYRLGYSREQILPNLDQKPFNGRRLDGTILAFLPHKGGVPEYIAENLVGYSIAKPLHSDNFITARNNGFETSNFLLLNCSLVNDFQVNSSHNDHVTTINTNILQRVNISTNRSSWINYESFNSAYEHALDGKTISNFWVSMNDQINKEFSKDHFKNFSLCLKITSHDKEENESLNERSVEKIRELMFKKQHKCIE
jgi:hypothetical protein